LVRGQHAESLVVFDEAHTTHIGGELEDDSGALAALRQLSLSLRSRERFSTSFEAWYHVVGA